MFGFRVVILSDISHPSLDQQLLHLLLQFQYIAIFVSYYTGIEKDHGRNKQ